MTEEQEKRAFISLFNFITIVALIALCAVIACICNEIVTPTKNPENKHETTCKNSYQMARA